VRHLGRSGSWWLASRRPKEFFEQSKVELKKVTWPTRQETVRTSVAVLVFSLVMALYLGVVDMILSRVVALILS